MNTNFYIKIVFVPRKLPHCYESRNKNSSQVQLILHLFRMYFKDVEVLAMFPKAVIATIPWVTNAYFFFQMAAVVLDGAS